jgi:dihydropyrimidinase
MKSEILIKNGLVIYPEKTLRNDVAIDDGIITAVCEPGEYEGKRVIDAEGCYVLPGAVDPHVHPVYLDKIKDSSRTGACGGVTTLVHYAYARPGNSLEAKAKEFKEEGVTTSHTDFALHGGLFETLKQVEEIPLLFNMGITSFKVFMSYAKLGWMTDDYAMSKMMDTVGKHGGMVAVHAETGLAIDYVMDVLLDEKNVDFAERFLETSPDIAEGEGIFRAVSIGRLFNCPVYIPHITSAKGVDVSRYLKSHGYTMYAETCPQYLGLTWEKLKSRGPLGKVGPSIKTEEDRIALWQGVKDGFFDTIGSDHAPKDKKEDDDFFDAPYGSPELETMLSVVWEYGVNRGIITPNRLVELMAENPAKILGLSPSKGRLDVGTDADVVVFDPYKKWTVKAAEQHSNSGYSLFEDTSLLGKVRDVFANGEALVENEEFVGEKSRGRFLPTQAG